MGIPVAIVTSRFIDRALRDAGEDFLKTYQLQGDLERRSKTSIFADRYFITNTTQFDLHITNDFESPGLFSASLVIFYTTLNIPAARNEPDVAKRRLILDACLSEGNFGVKYRFVWPTLDRLITTHLPLIVVYHPGPEPPGSGTVMHRYHLASAQSFQMAEAMLNEFHKGHPAVLRRVHFLKTPKVRLEKAVVGALDIMKKVEAAS